MVIKNVYNEENNVDKTWYNSSNIFYSEFTENKDDNFGQLSVTFKNGSTYIYKDVDMVHDYLMFREGGLDGSQGKALNQFIKPKYEYEKVEDKSIELLTEELEREMSKKNDKFNTYFISGHRNITEGEFECYKQAIINVLDENENAVFVVGDYQGVDIMAQNFLVDILNIDPNRVTVYHMFESPRNINPKITNTVGGFKTDSERDAAMTAASFRDIAFVRDCKVMSGTGENILRRNLFNI